MNILYYFGCILSAETLLTRCPSGRTDPELARAAPARCSLSNSHLPSRSCSIRLPLPLPRFVPSTNSISATSAPFHGFELRVGVKLRVDEPPFVQGASICYAASACCNSMFQMFSRYVASVVYQCCKSRSGCCTCCNGYTRMFEVYVSSVPDECCKYFVWMLQK